MAPIAKENEVLAATTPSAPVAETPGKTQAVALELPVSVNGARTVEGSDKREPFSEATKTVLVFGHGAVIRLTSPVAPGQLLFLTNEKTKKEVVCQVVKSKNYRNVSGYVELEFTEPVVGFWGMRFPSDRLGAQAPAASLPSTTQAPIGASLPKTPSPAEPKTDATANFNALKALTNTSSTTSAESTVSTPVIAPPPTAIEAPLANSVPSIVPEPPKQAAPSDTSSEALKQQAARLQEQLSSMLFSEPVQQAVAPEAIVAPRDLGETAAKILEFVKPEPSQPAALTPTPVPLHVETPNAALISAKAAQPANSNSKSLLDVEEVKIPSWLEPLARNAASASAAEPLAAKEEPRHKNEAIFSSSLVAESLADTAPPTAEADTTPFASSYVETEEPAISAPAKSSNKGILIGTIAAGLLLAAAGVTWYLRSQDSPQQAGGRPVAPVSSPAQTSTPSPTQGISNGSTVAQTGPVTSPLSTAAAAPTAVTSTNPSGNNSENAANVSLNNAVVRKPEPAPAQVHQVEPPVKKPALGEVRLAAPKVTSGSKGSLSADEPGIAFNGTESAPAGALTGLGSANSKQPVAPVEPLPVGGDVKSAKLLSSVAPVYPQLAKTQRVSGDVKVDALIDANGRVTTMKVVSGPTLLHQAAMDALRQWKYQPATLDGKPVAMHLTVTLQFRLQ